MNFLKALLGVVAGVFCGGLLVALVEYLGHLIYPLPAGVDTSDPEVMKELVAAAPVGALLSVVLAWAVGSLGGGWLGAKIARSSQLTTALLVGAILMSFGLLNLLMLPHPAWFWPVSLAVFLPAAYLGGRLAAR